MLARRWAKSSRLPFVGTRWQRDALERRLGEPHLHHRGVWQLHLTVLRDGGAIHGRNSQAFLETGSGLRLRLHPRGPGEEDERRLRFIKNARSAGLTLGEVKEVLAFHERGEPPCAYVTEAIARRAEEIERQIGELIEFKRELDRLHERALNVSTGEPRPQDYCHKIES